VEEALRESEEGLRWVIGGSSIPAFVIDKGHRIIHWNQACESLVGLKFSGVVGTSNQWKAFYPHERPVMADLIVEGAGEHEIEDYYRGRYTKSKLIEGAYEAEDFSLISIAGFTSPPAQYETQVEMLLVLWKHWRTSPSASELLKHSNILLLTWRKLFPGPRLPETPTQQVMSEG
jgi:hypothetical protein